MLHEEKEVPSIVRKSLDHSYDVIRMKAKKKKRNVMWRKLAVAACCFVIAGSVFTNKHVQANINKLFHFNDKGIERAVDEEFPQKSNSIATDKGITVALDRYFADANKLGFSFQLVFEDTSILKKQVSEVSFDYRLKNGDGKYIMESIPDTKPLKGKKVYMSKAEDKNPSIDGKTGKVQYDVVFESNQGSIPKLKDAVLEIESVKVFYENDERKEIDGIWNLPISDKTKEEATSTVEYRLAETRSNIQIVSAKANPTSLNLTFSVDEVVEDENTFMDMKMVDETGKEYKSKGYSQDVENGKTTVYVNFPITSYDKANTLKLQMKKFGEIELVRKSKDNLHLSLECSTLILV
ncbi:hypothetical protein CN568_04105 [Bacillus pseudomycoides]|nr:hypothetical protein CN691_26815 [Bacillus pseudomycoides]PEK71864.1 hypothetical protein CN593_03430 [Bacillus pseudomycoides]PEP45873.1 hypothetical protein CN565_02895 [Bacillus pseudomycoides]PEP47628.1 hypothetical protein CN568_04105 [Bacillus pseudomycoides]PFX56417.1 hypothetical protein COL31_09075 [Bacillus pseudomycoides]